MALGPAAAASGWASSESRRSYLVAAYVHGPLVYATQVIEYPLMEVFRAGFDAVPRNVQTSAQR